MRHIPAIILCLIIALAAAGCGDSASGDGTGESSTAAPAAGSSKAVQPTASKTDAPPAPAAPGDGTQLEPFDRSTLPNPQTDEERIAAAENLIRQMVEAYASAPVMTDSIIERYTMQGQMPPPQRREILLGPGTELEIMSPTLHILSTGGTLYVDMPNRPHAYCAQKIVGSFFDTFLILSEQQNYIDLPSLHLTMRLRRPMDEIIKRFALQMEGEPRLSGYRVIEDNDGRVLEQITLISETGSSVVNVDPRTKFIVSGSVEYSPIGTPDGFVVKRDIKFDPHVLKEMPRKLTYDPGNRKQVDTIRAINWLPPVGGGVPDLKISKGEVIPDFELYTIDGEERRLSDARGSAVILFFWAGRSPQSQHVLLELNGFYEWIQGSGLPIEIWPINVWEEGETQGEKWNRVDQLWQRRHLPFPSLFDPQNALAETYGVYRIPTFVIVDPEGRMTWSWCGYKDDIIPELQEQATKALGKEL